VASHHESTVNIAVAITIMTTAVDDLATCRQNLRQLAMVPAASTRAALLLALRSLLTVVSGAPYSSE